MQPGAERTQCVIKKLGNTSRFRVGSIHNVLATGSHHLIVYRTNDTVERPEPFDCDPFVDTLDPESGSPLMITQKYEELLTLPEGVAYTFEPFLAALTTNRLAGVFRWTSELIPYQAVSVLMFGSNFSGDTRKKRFSERPSSS